MIKYKKPISVSKKFQYGGTVTMGADYAPGRLEWLSRAWEGFKDWNRASAASTGKVVSKAIPKVTPIARTVSKVAGPIGIASMILTPAQANVGEDELFRNPSSPFYRGRFLTESSDGQASEEQANESAATKEGVAAGTVSNPQEDPNKKKDKKKEEKKETKANTFTRKITNGTNSIDQFWGNRLNWWETSKNSTATPFVRGLHNFITRPIVAYEFVREGIPGGIELAKVLGGLDNTFDPRPLWGSPRLLPKIQSDSTTQDIQSNQPIQFNYSDTTQNRQMIDSVQQLNEKRSLYGL